MRTIKGSTGSPLFYREIMEEPIRLTLQKESWERIFQFLDYNGHLMTNELTNITDLLGHQYTTCIKHNVTDIQDAETPGQLKLFNQQELNDESTQNAS